MNLLPTPEVTISDSDVEDALRRAVGIINPLLDVLSSDPLRVKRRTPDFADGPLDKVADGLAWALNVADVPGTSAWDHLDVDARIHWWVRRVGALSTVAVAFPGVLGAVGRTLPIQDLLGFANQAIVLCAVARELGVTDRASQARLLAEVLCDRDFTDSDSDSDSNADSEADADVDADVDEPEEPISRTPLGIAKALWRLVGLFDAIGDEVAKRPRPRGPFHYLGMLPGVGAFASYIGEGRALSRAAKDARRWVDRHATEVTA
ncbi:hypothetical protein [Mycolicibacterium confluentis]|uniref:Uncharacterized protein n=1 Tax=Mycolicibacterium confluentis TaxID=28047 RepID=A0A7I7XSG2_9MYCO|nr:hypothetical protein [Mycolicibacterium confluentis]MCV7321422.1 hypothetical protein [Mycolicibacterium confluentis]ORV33040.1 hypothetical protein AWB99_08450 [Mycolicibacterium confluentis]BBZ32094.1 hypothetical protein MCNF_06990 [Mycolicibacterium confluentis]